MKNNPYIGPRPYQRGEGNFFGREREGKELAWLILAEQAVLFYAQSGAGKTSLLNARVIPILEKKGVLVLPVARVGSGLPASIDPGQVDNIFVLSALLSLSADQALPPESLLGHSLLSFLQEYCQRPTPALQSPISNLQLPTSNFQPPTSNPQSPTLLIFDQFEEIATTHREHWDKAEGFFRQVREVIDALPGLGVLFVLREDYVAELDPYTPLLPSHLQARFRMTLPTRQQAMQIVMGPAEKAGCPFDEEAAQNLVTNLSRIKTSLSSPLSGGTEGGGSIGQYVEPVQLQVVCQQLWASLPEAAGEDHLVEWDEIKHYDVDQALTNFYENTLADVRNQVSGRNLVSERRLRRWFSEQLITPEGRRGLALQGQEETAGLPNAVVTALENHHLIRSEVRGGSRWYELSHDRLVEPIQQSNQAWEAAQDQQHPWRPIARQWQKAHSDTLLYRGKEMQEAQSWLNTANPGEVEPYEREFIQASHKMERTRTRTRLGYMFAFAILLVLVGVLGAPPLYRQYLRWRARTLEETVSIGSSQALLGHKSLFEDGRALEEKNYQVSAFDIEKYEVTNERYLLCVEARACGPPNASPSEYRSPKHSRYPVIGVTALQASQFCAWIGRRLPTELEWERAARSSKGYKWPWGDSNPVTYTQAYLSYGGLRLSSVQDVRRASEDRSQDGVYDLAGNAWEWTCTPYIEGVYDPNECADLDTQFPEKLITKGCDVTGLPDAIQCTMAYHTSMRPSYSNSLGGFRCVADP